MSISPVASGRSGSVRRQLPVNLLNLGLGRLPASVPALQTALAVFIGPAGRGPGLFILVQFGIGHHRFQLVFLGLETFDPLFRLLHLLQPGAGPATAFLPLLGLQFLPLLLGVTAGIADGRGRSGPAGRRPGGLPFLGQLRLFQQVFA